MGCLRLLPHRLVKVRSRVNVHPREWRVVYMGQSKLQGQRSEQ